MKIDIISIVVIVVMVGLAFLGLHFYEQSKLYKQKFYDCQYQNTSLQNALKTQNQALEALRLESSVYEQNKPKFKEVIKNQIDSIPKTKLETCEQALDYISKILRLQSK
ncbi:hypothetical protein [Helicobacter sp. 13S00477-4]|uniref:hypothetical protein n=1 Tax=Helicobacter sp. 13S00477-4 TaxID=1905759 RepID=UPI000BA670C3|nr:hypothetical protein [Helicobacter sp. 13S00477-4]PAF52000.1 hypothetical protein BKH44_04895 [Helicobacter sp. 13S00477-4]